MDGSGSFLLPFGLEGERLEYIPACLCLEKKTGLLEVLTTYLSAAWG